MSAARFATTLAGALLLVLLGFTMIMPPMIYIARRWDAYWLGPPVTCSTVTQCLDQLDKADKVRTS